MCFFQVGVDNSSNISTARDTQFRSEPASLWAASCQPRQLPAGPVRAAAVSARRQLQPAVECRAAAAVKVSAGAVAKRWVIAFIACNLQIAITSIHRTLLQIELDCIGTHCCFTWFMTPTSKNDQAPSIIIMFQDNFCWGEINISSIVLCYLSRYTGWANCNSVSLLQLMIDKNMKICFIFCIYFWRWWTSGYVGKAHFLNLKVFQYCKQCKKMLPL